MVLPTFKPATYEDLFDLPENLVGEINEARTPKPLVAEESQVICSCG